MLWWFNSSLRRFFMMLWWFNSSLRGLFMFICFSRCFRRFHMRFSSFLMFSYFHSRFNRFHMSLNPVLTLLHHLLRLFHFFLLLGLFTSLQPFRSFNSITLRFNLFPFLLLLLTHLHSLPLIHFIHFFFLNLRFRRVSLPFLRLILGFLLSRRVIFSEIISRGSLFFGSFLLIYCCGFRPFRDLGL